MLWLASIAERTRKMLSDQERDVRLGAFRRHGKIGERSGFVSKRQSLRALFGNETGSFREASSHRATLI